MASFQIIVLSISLVFLLILLIIIGISLSNASASQQWPPSVGECPDYWTDDAGNGAQCVNISNLGSCPASQGNTSTATSDTHLTMDFTTPTYSGSSGTCNKYTWANRCGITWDGITSGVTNPCVSKIA